MSIYERIRLAEEKLPKVKVSEESAPAGEESGAPVNNAGAPSANASANGVSGSTERQLSLSNKPEIIDPKKQAELDYAQRFAEALKLAIAIDDKFGKGYHADATQLQSKLMNLSAPLGADLGRDVSTQLYVDRTPVYTAYKIERDGSFTSFNGDLPSAPAQAPAVNKNSPGVTHHPCNF